MFRRYNYVIKYDRRSLTEQYKIFESLQICNWNIKPSKCHTNQTFQTMFPGLFTYLSWHSWGGKIFVIQQNRVINWIIRWWLVYSRFCWNRQSSHIDERRWESQDDNICICSAHFFDIPMLAVTTQSPIFDYVVKMVRNTDLIRHTFDTRLTEIVYVVVCSVSYWVYFPIIQLKQTSADIIKSTANIPSNALYMIIIRWCWTTPTP